MTKLKQLFILLAIVLSVPLSAQTVLTKAETLELLMSNNFDIKLSETDIETAINNNSIWNSGKLPTLSGNANITFNSDNISVEFADGTSRDLNGQQSDSRTAGLSLGYVIFNGFNRKYNIERNAENLNLSQLNAKSVLETVLLNTFTAYYQVARNQQSVERLKETLAVSKERLTRTEFGFDYGRNTRLDVSTAQVDVNTDSINYLNALQALSDQKRNLSFILGQELAVDFAVDTSLVFDEFVGKDELKERMFRDNVLLAVAESGVKISMLNTKVNNANYFPTLSANAGYNTSLRNNNSAAFTAANSSSGITGGLSLGWNIFDGGGSRTAVQNAKVNEKVQQLTLEQTKQQASLDFENAWSDYENKLFIVRAQENNLQTNQQNFERTQERYRLGQVGSLDFRTAQTNLLTAQTNLIEARYEAKLAELLIVRLSGAIQQAQF